MDKQNKSTYLPLTRKYRPHALGDIHAQETFTEILAKAISTNQLSHAYMLTGIRGIGKTSLARVIAKTISCTNNITKESKLYPCGECQNCTQYLNGIHPDITEIDAASHTGVDDIRSIIEDADYRPLLGRYKIYIIDEVHMLSKGAFNALLKIIEEPPSHLLFIFATTEIQKVPDTVISRCQRFDLKRFTLEQLEGLLRDVAEKESLLFDDMAIKTIAIKSQGSARDALSLMEQAKVYVGKDKITAEVVHSITGTANLGQVTEIVSNIFNKQIEEAIGKVDTLYFSSVNLASFLENFLESVLICCKLQIAPDIDLEQYSPFKSALLEIANKTPTEKLTLIWQLAINCLRDLKDTDLYLQSVEMLFIKILCVLSMEENIHSSQDKQTSQGEDNFLFILEHLYKNRSFELYYYLMHEVEILGYDGKILKISKEASKAELNLKLTAELKIVNPLVNIVTQEIKRNPVTLKQRLVEFVTRTEKWETLKKHFNVQGVSDILFCKNMNE